MYSDQEGEGEGGEEGAQRKGGKREGMEEEEEGKISGNPLHWFELYMNFISAVFSPIILFTITWLYENIVWIYL